MDDSDDVDEVLASVVEIGGIDVVDSLTVSLELDFDSLKKKMKLKSVSIQIVKLIFPESS